ncbi:hypothetical protein [Miniphocaeibacter massiliensis]|uniref:hypothetical protein n=1 Tax=Miniphocaeibacter massiliensis TaxID=2041841 RepID=UPI000C1C29A3|nr:hypothetical protein [Miniphocaeibacter massiliensis]
MNFKEVMTFKDILHLIFSIVVLILVLSLDKFISYYMENTYIVIIIELVFYVGGLFLIRKILKGSKDK